MLSSRCEQNALIGIFTCSESHFLYDPFFAGLCIGWRNGIVILFVWRVGMKNSDHSKTFVN